jgi:hypothetical protein
MDHDRTIAEFNAASQAASEAKKALDYERARVVVGGDTKAYLRASAAYIRALEIEAALLLALGRISEEMPDHVHTA